VVVLLGLCAVSAAAQVGPDEIITVDLPLFAIEDEQAVAPAVAYGEIAFPAGCSHCQIHRTQYRIIVPDGAYHLIVELENLDDPNGDIDLLLSYETANSEDETTIYADYASRGYGGSEAIVLPLDTEDGLRAGVYYVGVMSLVGEGATFELRAFAYVPANAVTAPTTAPVGGFTTYCDPAAGFSVVRPADWVPVPAGELVEDEIAGFKTVETSVGDRAVFKISRSFGTTTGTVQEGYEQLRAMMEAEAGYVFLDKSDLTVAGVPAIKYTFQRQYELGPATVVFVYWIADDAEWALTFACTPVSSYAAYAEALNRAVSSFRFVATCSEEDRAGVTTPPVASTVVTSTTAGTVSDPSGARIDVPAGAVPRNQDGGEGEMLFTIKQGTALGFGIQATPPRPDMVATQATYDLGPSGFVLAEPITVTFPLPADYDPAAYTPQICRYDPETGEWVVMGGVLDETGTSIRVDVVHLSFFSIYLNPMSSRAWGALEFSAVVGKTATMCIDSYELAYPGLDGGSLFRWSPSDPVCIVPALGSPGSNNKVRWLLPQGTYRIGVTIWGFHSSTGGRELIGHYFIEDVQISAPSSYPDYAAMRVDWDEPVPFPGQAPCRVVQSYSVGVGEINVRLEWNAYCDLDLWVVDPNGETIDYLNTTSSSGGSLDQDNRCSDFVMGRPENIFWAADPPRGTYKVYVDYYEDCGGAGVVTFKVTWYVNGVADSRTGTISPPASPGEDGDEILVVEFTF
jgi:hypothetical protein